MFGTNTISGLGGLSLGKVISGISKTINIANQVIPLYQQVKPMISNAKGALSILKTMNSPTSKPKEKEIPKEKEENIHASSNPVFFV